MMKTAITFAAAILSFAFLASAAIAQDAGAGLAGRRAGWRAMRQERIAVCANKSAGTPCSFERRGKKESGVCQTTRRGELICHSATGRRRRMRGMGGPSPAPSVAGPAAPGVSQP
jgi:hypothetical protein